MSRFNHGTLPSHGFVTGDKLIYSALDAPLGGLTDGLIYYAIKISDDKIALAFQKHLEHVESWLDEQPNIEVLYVDYNATLRYPAHSIQLVDRFLGSVLDTQKMAQVIDPALYRRRG